MALNYADIGIRVLPSYAGDVLADQIRPDRPGAKTPGVDTPLPGKGEAGSFTQFATTPSQETEVDLTVDYSTSDDSGGPTGTAYPVKGAKPFELNITAINTAQIDPAAYSPASPSSFKEWLTSKVDERLGTNYTFNPITGGYRPTGPGGAIGLALPGPLAGFAQLGAAASQRSLENIAGKAYAGEEGYAVAYVNGRVVGVSPGLFGGYTLTGQLPANLSPQQRQSIVRQLIDIPSESAAGAYRPEGMTAAESIAGAGKASDTDTTPLPADTPLPDYSYTAYEPSGGDDSDTDYGRTEYTVSSGGSSNPADSGYRMNAEGGRIDMADGGSADPIQGNGFVDGSPDNYTESQTVADDEYRRVRPGSFVMNAPMTEKLQEAGVLPRGVDNPAKKSTIKANEGGMVDVALSKGEYVFEPEEAEEIGYDVLNKINDMGKPEVDRRQAAAKGGFIDGYKDGGMPLPQSSPIRPSDEDVVEYPLSLAQAYARVESKFDSVEEADAEIDKIIDELPSEDLLAYMMYTESSVLGDEGMRASGHVAMNRVESDYKDFAKIKDLRDMVKAKTSRGSRQFNTFNISQFRKNLKRLTMSEYGRQEYAKVRNLAEDIFYGLDEDNTAGALFFRNPATSTDKWLQKQIDEHLLATTASVGEGKMRHEYYRPADLMTTRYIY